MGYGLWGYDIMGLWGYGVMGLWGYGVMCFKEILLL
jgi:hypothetical protein